MLQLFLTGAGCNVELFRPKKLVMFIRSVCECVCGCVADRDREVDGLNRHINIFTFQRISIASYFVFENIFFPPL